MVSAGNCQSPCPGRLDTEKVDPLCAARWRWFLGVGEEYFLTLVSTGGLPAGGFSAEGCPFSQSGSLQYAACDGSDQPGEN